MAAPLRLPERTRGGLILLTAAVALSAAFRAVTVLVPARLDAALAAGLFLVAIAALAAAGIVRLPPRVWQLAVPAVLLTAAMLWRDTPVLFALDIAAFGSVVLLLVPQARAPRVARAGVSDYLRAGVMWAGSTVLGPLPLAAREIDWTQVPAGPVTTRVRRVGLGFAAAVPCLVVFGSLFRSADPAYDRALARFVSVDFGPAAEHGAVVLAVGWCLAGYLWLAFRSSPPRRLVPRHGRIGSVEVVSGLGAVLALFVSFTALQLSYLFGGEEAVRAMGLTYAEYARRGFFELVTVAVLTVPLLLVADWAVAASDGPGRRRMRWMEGALVGVVFVLLASALDRMRLYTEMYGLTELRLYTTAFMGWLAVVLGWFVATVLQGRRTRFAWGAAVAGWLVLGALHLVNPDGLIVTTNAGRDRPFDVAYAGQLSGDAVPSLLAVMQALPASRRCAFAREAIGPIAAAAGQDDRWTLGRAAARRALAQDPAVARCGVAG
jgi:hypothetical protein